MRAIDTLTRKEEKFKRSQLQTKSYRLLLHNAESWRNSLPQGTAQQLVIQSQMVIPESLHMQVTQTEQVVFVYVCVSKIYDVTDVTSSG